MQGNIPELWRNSLYELPELQEAQVIFHGAIEPLGSHLRCLTWKDRTCIICASAAPDGQGRVVSARACLTTWGAVKEFMDQGLCCRCVGT